jgi:hypothetical protein
MFSSQNTLNLHQTSRLNDDINAIRARERESVNVGENRIYNFYQQRNINSSVDAATQEQAIMFQDGYGVNQRNIDVDSQLRINQTQTNPRSRLNVNLNQRTFLSVPYMGRGRGDQYVESQLQQRPFVRVRPSFSSVTTQGFKNVFIPQIPEVKNYIRNPKNFIQEEADSEWVRGGIPTRLAVRDSMEGNH